MKAFTYIKKGELAFVEKAKPTIKDDKDAIIAELDKTLAL